MLSNFQLRKIKELSETRLKTAAERILENTTKAGREIQLSKQNVTAERKVPGRRDFLVGE